MKERIARFLNAVDAALVPVAVGERLDLYHIGRSALVWKHGFQSATIDIDVVRPRNDQRLVEEAVRLFGPGKPKALEFGLYLEVVPEALPERVPATRAAHRPHVLDHFATVVDFDVAPGAAGGAGADHDGSLRIGVRGGYVCTHPFPIPKGRQPGSAATCAFPHSHKRPVRVQIRRVAARSLPPP